jgi:hypothetical protein
MNHAGDLTNGIIFPTQFFREADTDSRGRITISQLAAFLQSRLTATQVGSPSRQQGLTPR